jgi:hypothetical protein
MGIIAATGAALFVSAAAPAHAANCGDLNGNSLNDPPDASILGTRILLGAQGTDCGGQGSAQCGDVSGANGLDTADLVSVLNLVAGNPVIGNCTSPGGAVCGTTVSGNITSSQTWGTPGGSGSGCTTTVNGTTFVSPGVTITIQRGARVEGVKGAATPSALVFLRGSKINAVGTPTEPIVFTSNQPDGSRGTGDWGGLVINGNARANCPAGQCLAEGLTGVEFGGSNDADNSGILQYASINFSGIELSADNELNVLTMNAVGSGTTMDHIQVNQGFDDGFEWFGGNVRMSYLVASSIGDDDFDWQLGYRGSVQYALGTKAAANSDNNGRHGFEGDNNENGFNFSPRSDPKFCNVTLVGTLPQGQAGTGRRGMLLRRGTAGKIRNTIVDGYTQSGIQMDDNTTAQQACVNATTLKTSGDVLSIKDSIVFGNGAVSSGNTSSPCTPAQWLTLLAATENLQFADPNINEVAIGYPVTSFKGGDAADGFVPTAAGATGASCQALDPGFFDPVTYIGAFEPGTGSAGNWLRTPGNWINFDTN